MTKLGPDLYHDAQPVQTQMRDEVLSGLTGQPKAVAPKFFYDALGSQLFDAICETPEYYPTRTEMAILQDNARAISALIGNDCVLIEPGSGSSRKVRLLLEALAPSAYVPMEICREHLLPHSRRLARDYPWLEVCAACADFGQLEQVPLPCVGKRRVVFFPGSTIGNFEPVDAVAFLGRVAKTVGPGGGLLIGVDLQKDAAILNAAYNDEAGITARFNRNLLERFNRELQADFLPDEFDHHAFYDRERGRVEMHLISRKAQRVTIDGHALSFAHGESIHTENSYKYSLEGFRRMASRVGFRSRGCWTDPARLFSVHYLELD